MPYTNYPDNTKRSIQRSHAMKFGLVRTTKKRETKKKHNNRGVMHYVCMVFEEFRI